MQTWPPAVMSPREHKPRPEDWIATRSGSGLPVALRRGRNGVYPNISFNDCSSGLLYSFKRVIRQSPSAIRAVRRCKKHARSAP
jgi:hypothetical protein